MAAPVSASWRACSEDLTRAVARGYTPASRSTEGTMLLRETTSNTECTDFMAGEFLCWSDVRDSCGGWGWRYEGRKGGGGGGGRGEWDGDGFLKQASGDKIML